MQTRCTVPVRHHGWVERTLAVHGEQLVPVVGGEEEEALDDLLRAVRFLHHLHGFGFGV